MSDRTRNDLVADDWETLQQLIFRDSRNATSGRYRSPYVFRGCSNHEYSLSTSLARFVGDSGRWDLELVLLTDFLKHSHEEIRDSRSFYHLLSLAQHHGLPTRLLDWTSSPLVALYFATDGSADTDGVIWAVDYVKAHELIPELTRWYLDRAKTDMFDTEMLATMQDAIQTALRQREDSTDPKTWFRDIYREQEIVDGFADEHARASGDYVLFFQPPAMDARIVNQSALFSKQSNPRVPIDEWLEGHPELYWRIVVPGERKAEFRDRLDQMNVNRKTLFPGLDGIAHWLTEHHTPAAPW